MAGQIDVFSTEAIEKIRRDHERLRREVAELRQQVRAFAQTSEGECYEIGKTDGSGITAMSDDTPGSGTIRMYRIRADGTLVDTGTDESCKSSAGAVAADTYVGIQRDAWRIPWAMANQANEGLMKPFCRFTLDAALATSDASKSAAIQAQWGHGADHSTSITVNNLKTHTSGTYVFEGDSGDAGIAVYDPGDDEWRIIQMECP